MDIDAFSQHLRNRDRTPGTIRSYGQEINRFAAWFEQTNGQLLTPAGLTSRDVRDYREHMQTVAHAAPATINRRLAALRAYGAWLVDSGQLDSNPAQHARLVAEQQLAPRWLDRRQLAALERELQRAVQSARTEASRFRAIRNQAIGALLIYSGIRVGELSALEPGDLAITERAGWLTIRRGKGNKQRKLPVILEARRPLAAWLEIRPAGAALFCDQDGQALLPRGVQRAIEECGRLAGVPVTPHVLRHTYAKNLADAGVTATQIAALLGHSKLETTRIYTQPSERDLQLAVEKLGD